MPPDAVARTPHFFISRAGEEAAYATKVADLLREAGYQVTIQDIFRPGESFVHKITEGLAQADHLVAILTHHYLANDWTRSELYSARAVDPIGTKRFLILLRIDDCEIPRDLAHLAYVDLVGQDETTKRRLILEAVSPTIAREGPDHRTSIASLPTVDPTLIGRDPQLAILNRAWANPATHFIQIIAPGGTGKTALMSKWYTALVNQTTIFGWSFYSQGTQENRQTSSDPFFAKVLPFFGLNLAPTESIYDKAEALARRLQTGRALLILDGLEPLQESSGDIRDPGLKTLLKELAANNQGLVLCTTRVRISEVPDDPPRVLSIDLDNLDPEDGAEYLRHLKVEGTEDELREASKAYGNHALALTLLGTYLAEFCQHDIRRRVEIPALIDPDLKTGQHARHVMEAYARMYRAKPELDILQALGYFDHPAEPEALKLVLPKMFPRKFQLALNNLRKARLILCNDPSKPIDCHPLVREHFAWVMRSTSLKAFRKGHSRLYDHYCKQAPEQPETLEEMTPLFYAVYHGCQADRHVEALWDIYHDRILRGGKFYLLHKLGAFGTSLSLLANFFRSPWTQPVPALSSADQTWLISNAAFSLRALGRLSDAVDPMTIAGESNVTHENWKNAANSYGNLSQLHLALGNVREAVAAARKAVDLADRSGDASSRIVSRTDLADPLHQSGDLAQSASLFNQAERLQAEMQPEYPILYSFGGYRYCDLLLTQSQAAEVLRRAAQTLAWVEPQHLLLNIGLDHLSLGRAHPSGSSESITHLNQAVEYLRRAGTLDHLPPALLARGTPHDLAEVFQIATRSGMRLYLTDYHLAMVRNLLATDPAQALHHFREAETLVAKTGYHRRDSDLAQFLRKTSRHNPRRINNLDF